MQLCFGCLHSFHPSAFEGGQCTFDEEVVMRFEGIRAIATKLQPSTPSARQQVAALEDEIKLLAKTMKIAVDDKNAEIAQLNAQVQFLGEQLERMIKEREQQDGAYMTAGGSSSGNATGGSARGGGGGMSPRYGGSNPSSGTNTNAPAPFPPYSTLSKAGAAISGSMVASGLLNRFLLASQKMPVTSRVGFGAGRLAGGFGGSATAGLGGGASTFHSDTYGQTVTATPVSGSTSARPFTSGGGGGGLLMRSHSPRDAGGVASSSASAASAFSHYKAQVSSAIYSLLEAVVVKTRADYGCVWIKVLESDGLVATFTAGRQHGSGGGSSHHGGGGGASNNLGGGGGATGRKAGGGRAKTGASSSSASVAVGSAKCFSSTAPYFIGVNSIPGSVSGTGVVLNMGAEVPVGARLAMGGGSGGEAEGADGLVSDNTNSPIFTPASEHDLLTNICTQHSSLTVPVFSRYGTTTRQSIAVLQLFGGSPMGTPFTVDDERLAEATSTLLSHIISTHYATLVGDWTTSTFNPSSIINNAQYYADIDQSPQTKGADGFPTPPMLVYRARYSGTLGNEVNNAAANLLQASKRISSGANGGSSGGGNGTTTFFLTQHQSQSHIPTPPPAVGSSRATRAGLRSADPQSSAASAATAATNNNTNNAPPPLKIRNLRADMAEFSTPFECYSGLRDLVKFLDELEELRRGGGGMFALQQQLADASSALNGISNGNNNNTNGGGGGGGYYGSNAALGYNNNRGFNSTRSMAASSVATTVNMMDMSGSMNSSMSQMNATGGGGGGGMLPNLTNNNGGGSARAPPAARAIDAPGSARKGNNPFISAAQFTAAAAAAAGGANNTANGAASSPNSNNASNNYATTNVARSKGTTINTAAMEQLEVDTISRLDALMAEARGKANR